METTRKFPKPKTKGVASVPVVMQLEALECGAASLTMIMHYYRYWIPLEQVRGDCGVSRDGASAKNILLAARGYGLSANAWKMEPEALQKEGPFPCILHWGFNHFVVLCGFRGGKAVVNDPARGRIFVSMEEFDKCFTGVVLTFEPSEKFVPSGKKKNVFDFARERLTGTSSAIAFLILTTTISSLLGALSPVFGRIFIDRVLGGKSPAWLGSLLAAMTIFTVVNIIVLWISAIYSLKIQGQMAASGSASYLWHVLRLPMQFFGQRMDADIVNRQATSASIAGTLVGTFAPLAINTIMMLFYLILMLRYSVPLTLIGLGAIAVNIFLSILLTGKRINITRVRLRDAAKLSAATASGIRMMETIKASGAENAFFGKWSGLSASVNTQNVRSQRADLVLGAMPGLVTALMNLAVLGGGVYLVLRGQFSVGSLMAFQGFLAAFFAPATALIAAGQSLQEMITAMERVDDVMKYPEDPCFREREKTEEYKKLRGLVEMKHVTFGYSKLAKPLIKDFSMTVQPGQKVAFVGRSGCGKSTLAKLISGLYQPWSGEIAFDGKNIAEIDRYELCGSLAVIDQDITLFEDTISDNIKMWDESIEDFEVVMAARSAGMHEDIVQRNGGYQHRMIEGGRDFSGGQRQRLEIARALAQNPTICILDEATSALDAKTEQEVVQSICEQGITCIVIAHRLSTVRDCDEIIVLDHGQVVERGTHEELFAKGGAYTALVTNE